jgi:CubicO group peptidase (beta-lactamase class C family)
LLDVWQGKAEHPFFYGEDLRTFFKKQRTGDEETWALGFDTPALKGSSSGHYLSTSSVGHLGFTGTSFWIDREKDLVVILLSNRVHPRRDNEAIRGFRPVFHNEIVLEYLQRRQT